MLPLLLLACTTADPVTDSESTAPSGETADSAAPEDTGDCPAADPEQDTETIYGHHLYRASSADGLTFTEQGLLLEHGSVPDAFVGPDGEVWMAFVNGQPGQHGTWVARPDGDGWSKHCLTVDGAFYDNILDPDVTRLDDGSWVLYYLQADPPAETGLPQDHELYRAVSTDGIHFTDPVLVYTDPEFTDPSVVLQEDGSVRMAVARGGSTTFLFSPDGVRFTEQGRYADGTVPELTRLADGRLRLFVRTSAGIHSATSGDGNAWVDDTGLRMADGFSPSIVEDEGQTWLYYLRQDE